MAMQVAPNSARRIVWLFVFALLSTTAVPAFQVQLLSQSGAQTQSGGQSA